MYDLEGKLQWLFDLRWSSESCHYKLENRLNLAENIWNYINSNYGYGAIEKSKEYYDWHKQNITMPALSSNKCGLYLRYIKEFIMQNPYCRRFREFI